MKLHFRKAKKVDIPCLIQMLSDDILGAQREDNSVPINQRYVETFGHINTDPNNELIVVENESSIVGMLQLTFIPYLTHLGSWRCLIEGVRIHSTQRGKGLGTDFINWSIERAKQRRCSIVQLTSDKQRPDAIRFYEDLGFKASHEGLKLKL
ncbi:MAG: GNAT family N-acetyltransferase [Gammaproteobacteria bacterium]|nr:MAG: GNAT family N-acetyltransferase [Gammaproteobacteria bacterium]